MKIKFKRSVYPSIISILVLIVSFLNYTPNTYLMGFDSIHQEFNLFLSLQRSLSVWQENTGLGAQGSMSYASDLGRVLVYLLLSPVIPSSLLRYFWVFGMLLAGVLVMFYFLKDLFNRLDQQKKAEEMAFIGSLFYFFNLSTLQLFYSNFDGFVTQFGVLPWILWCSRLIYVKNSQKYWIVLGLLTFFSTIQGYTGTLFIAFCIYYVLYLAFLGWGDGSGFSNLKIRKSATIFLFFFSINLFWFLPLLFFIFKGAGFVSESSLNHFSSEQSFLLNRKYGTILNNIELKNFWFETTDYDNLNQKFVPLLESWITHLNTPEITFIGYLITGVLIIGFFYSFMNRKTQVFSLLFLLSLFFLSAGNFPFEFLFNFLREYVPYFKEALRFPYTKFSVLASFAYSVLFALGVSFLVDKTAFFFKKTDSTQYIKFVFIMFFSIVMIVRFFPYFQGYLLNPNMRIVFPKEYLELFDFMNKQSEQGRVFLAPADTFWAWSYYSFGYRGSGFINYGLKQPVLARSFDSLNKDNENVYWELNKSIETNNIQDLQNVINKYGINWVLLDENVISPNQASQKEYNSNFYNLLQKIPNLVKKEYRFNNLKLIELNTEVGFVKTYSDIKKVHSWDGIKHFDPIYSSFGDYVLAKSKDDPKMDVYFPYSYVFSNRLSKNSSFSFYNEGGVSSFSLNPYEEPRNKFENFYLKSSLYQIGADQSNFYVLPKYFGSFTFSTPINPEYYGIFDQEGRIFMFGGSKDNTIEVNENDPKLIFLKAPVSSLLPIQALFSDDLSIDSCLGQYGRGSFTYRFDGSSIKIESTGENNQVCFFSDIRASLFEAGSVVKIKLPRANSSYESALSYCLIDKTDPSKCLKYGELSESNDYSLSFYADKRSENYSLYFYFNPKGFDSEWNLQNQVQLQIFNNYDDVSLVPIQNLYKPSQIFGTRYQFQRLEFNNTRSFTNLCGSSKINQFLGDRNSPFIYNSKDPICFNLFENYDKGSNLPAGGVFAMKYSSKSDRSPVVCNGFSDSCGLMDKLQPEASGQWGIGFLSDHANVFRVDLESSQGQDSFFTLDEFLVSSVDVSNLGRIYFEKAGKVEKNTSSIEPSSRINSWLYYLGSGQAKDSRKLVLRQGSDIGWVAFCGFSICEKSGEYNGWGNAWEVNHNQFLIVIYLPQLLLFLGVLIQMFTLKKIKKS